MESSSSLADVVAAAVTPVVAMLCERFVDANKMELYGR